MYSRHPRTGLKRSLMLHLSYAYRACSKDSKSEERQDHTSLFWHENSLPWKALFPPCRVPPTNTTRDFKFNVAFRPLNAQTNSSRDEVTSNSTSRNRSRSRAHTQILSPNRYVGCDYAATKCDTFPTGSGLVVNREPMQTPYLCTKWPTSYSKTVKERWRSIKF